MAHLSNPEVTFTALPLQPHFRFHLTMFSKAKENAAKVKTSSERAAWVPQYTSETPKFRHPERKAVTVATEPHGGQVQGLPAHSSTMAVAIPTLTALRRAFSLLSLFSSASCAFSSAYYLPHGASWKEFWSAFWRPQPQAEAHAQQLRWPAQGSETVQRPSEEREIVCGSVYECGCELVNARECVWMVGVDMPEGKGGRYRKDTT